MWREREKNLQLLKALLSNIFDLQLLSLQLGLQFFDLLAAVVEGLVLRREGEVLPDEPAGGTPRGFAGGVIEIIKLVLFCIKIL